MKYGESFGPVRNFKEEYPMPKKEDPRVRAGSLELLDMLGKLEAEDKEANALREKRLKRDVLGIPEELLPGYRPPEEDIEFKKAA